MEPLLPPVPTVGHWLAHWFQSDLLGVDAKAGVESAAFDYNFMGTALGRLGAALTMASTSDHDRYVEAVTQ